MFFPPNLVFVNSFFLPTKFLFKNLSCAALWKTNATANNKQHHEKSHTAMYVIVFVWLHWVRRECMGAPLGASTRGGCYTHFLPPTRLRHRHTSKGRRCHKDHIMASWHFFTKTAAGKIRYCKRLLSHTGQKQACTRITRLFVRHHAKNGPIHRKMVVIVPLVITSKVRPFFRLHKTGKRNEWSSQSFA